MPIQPWQHSIRLAVLRHRGNPSGFGWWKGPRRFTVLAFHTVVVIGFDQDNGGKP